MAHVENSIVIARDVADVFAFADNPTHEPVWRSALVDAAYTSEGPPGVGSTGRETSRWLGREAEIEWVITEYRPNERVAYTVMQTGESTSATTAYVYEAVPEGTRFTFMADAPDNSGTFGRLPDSLILRIARQSIAKDLRRLKQLLEA